MLTILTGLYIYYFLLALVFIIGAIAVMIFDVVLEIL